MKRHIALAIAASALMLTACEKKPPIEDMVDDAASDAAVEAIDDSPRISQMETDIQQMQQEIRQLQADVQRAENEIDEHKLLDH